MDNNNLNQIPRRKTRSVLATGGVLAALGAGYAIGTNVNAQQGAAAGTPAASAPVVNTPATRDAASMQDAFAAVAKAAEPAVVTITTERKMTTANRGMPGMPGSPRMRPFGGGEGGPGGGQGDPFEEFMRRFRDFGFSPNSAQKEELRGLWKEVQNRPSGLGSGMIYRQDGLILTNAHVVKGADNVLVKLSDGREFSKAKVLGVDERSDVAVVKIEATNLPTVKFGDSGNVRVGDYAIAVGNPFGLEHTVTVGVISAKAREVDAFSRQRSTAGEYLQTDASINPGNSGGPLFDIYGRVIGVNNAIYSESGGNIGIGFAIPINVARDIADRLVTDGKIRRGYLGVSIETLEEEDARGMGLPTGTKGVRIAEVNPDTPGARAGLEVGDIVQEINGQVVTKSTELQRTVQAAPVNSKATLKVLRGNKTVNLTATLDELKDDVGAAQPTAPEAEKAEPRTQGTALSELGVSVKTLTPALATQLKLKVKQGVVISDIKEDSPAANAGLSEGDVILRVGITPVASVAEMQAAVKALLAGQPAGDKKVSLYANVASELDPSGSGRRNVFVTLTVTQ
jgi:serine protease Do